MYIHVFVDHVSFDRLSLCTFDLRFQTVFEHLKFDRSLQQQQRQLRHLEIVTAVGDCCWVEIEKKKGILR